MTTKLTLTIDDTVIDKAKKFAKKEGRSLSSLVENYLKIVSEDVEKTEKNSKVERLLGSLKLPDSATSDYKEEINKLKDERFEKKWGY